MAGRKEAVQMRIDADGTIRESGAIVMQGKECELIASYLKALDGIGYREWGMVVEIVEHGFERQQRAMMQGMRFGIDDDVQRELMREAAR